jgi:hypothetical protein
MVLFFMLSPTIASDTNLIIKSSKSVEYYPDSTIKKAKLRTLIIIQGIPCEQWIHLDASGNLSQCKVARDTTYRTVFIPKKTIMNFNPTNGRFLACFPRDVFIQAVMCKGRSWDLIQTGFYSNGKLSGAFLAKEMTIQGIPCKASVFHGVGFHENGSLSKCTLSKDHTNNNITYKSGTKITLSLDGTIIEQEK